MRWAEWLSSRQCQPLTTVCRSQNLSCTALVFLERSTVTKITAKFFWISWNISNQANESSYLTIAAFHSSEPGIAHADELQDSVTYDTSHDEVKLPLHPEAPVPDKSFRSHTGSIYSKPNEIQYTVEDVPPWYLCMILGFQVSTVLTLMYDPRLLVTTLWFPWFQR